jgi:menaquinone-9 beta-reductase
MGQNDHDLVVVGGGIGGAALAKRMAEGGARVLVIERESEFRDRVRGEWLAPWGVDEAKRLDVFDDIGRAGGHLLPFFCIDGRDPVDLTSTTSCRQPALGFHHPVAQEQLLQAAAEAGAEVWRGTAAKVQITHGGPQVVTRYAGRENTLAPRLVVAADGRNSRTRGHAGFIEHRDPEYLNIAGLLLDGMASVPDDSAYVWQGSWATPDEGIFALLFPQGHGRVRAYIACLSASDYRLSGLAAIEQFIALFAQAGMPPEILAHARAAGPLASFSGADRWIPHPYRNGVALIGDAAATSDPLDGQGMSLTLRDVRVLSDLLLEHDDWDAAGHAYAAEHDRYYGVCHTYCTWRKQLSFTIGAQAIERRAAVQRIWADDRTRNPGVIMNGPDVVLDEEVRRRYFCEDVLGRAENRENVPSDGTMMNNSRGART